METVNSNILERMYHKSTHLVMLQDKIRINSYINAIKNNKIDFKNKVVADIGAGSGVLTILAIKFGAKKVYAIEGQISTIPLLKRMLKKKLLKRKFLINKINSLHKIAV